MARVSTPTLDHLVYGVTDLQAAVERVAAATGVRPVEGGRHLGRSTRNYLLGLTATAYLEIIGLDEENPPGPGVRVPFGLDHLTRDRLITWAIHPADAAAVAVESARLGADHGALETMSRLTTSGETLTWRLALAQPDATGQLQWDGLAPFIIDWGSTRHPATHLPQVRLESFTLTFPDAARLRALLDGLGATSGPPLTLNQGAPALNSRISGPAGTLEL